MTNTQSQWILCPKCRGQNYQHAAFCMHCGTPMRVPPVRRPNSLSVIAGVALSGVALIILVGMWRASSSPQTDTTQTFTPAPATGTVAQNPPDGQKQPTPATQPQTGQAPPDNSAQVSQDIKQYMYENFGGAGNPQYTTSWYQFITSFQVSMHGNEYDVSVHTSIWKDSDAAGPAQSIYSAFKGFSKYPIRSVTVWGKSGWGDVILKSD